MREIVYYVAISLDGFISGQNNDITGFVADGEGVAQYMADLKTYDTVIMGRNTYEFGYDYGLQPGQPAYPHMQHYIFSDHLVLPDPHAKVKVVPRQDLPLIEDLKTQKGSDIYLCGGAILAGWLLNHQMIDRLKIKLNPLILGDGLPLFSGVRRKYLLTLVSTQSFNDGLHIIEYNISYNT